MSKSGDRRHFEHKSIRDPFYGFINASKKEIGIVDSDAFRRLQDIRQLS